MEYYFTNLDFPEIVGDFLSLATFWGPRSCEVATIWPEKMLDYIKNWMGPIPNRPLSPKQVAIELLDNYSGFFGVRETWILWVRFLRIYDWKILGRLGIKTMNFQKKDVEVCNRDRVEGR